VEDDTLSRTGAACCCCGCPNPPILAPNGVAVGAGAAPNMGAGTAGVEVANALTLDPKGAAGAVDPKGLAGAVDPKGLAGAGAAGVDPNAPNGLGVAAGG
jgi:hypothetical protein